MGKIKAFISSINKAIISPFRFVYSMLTESGDVSSKRTNGTVLIVSGIILGFTSRMPDVPERMKVLIYGGCALLGVMAIGDAINNVAGNFVKKRDYKDDSDKSI
jgi:hypothetical protein